VVMRSDPSARPSATTIGRIAVAIVGGEPAVIPMLDGVSTFVYRIRRGHDTFYLRVLPEEGATFAPEAGVHLTLRDRGVRVPEVVHWEDLDPSVGRSVMLTREIPGTAVSNEVSPGSLPSIFRVAGRDLALINSVPVDGFGWIKRDRPGDASLRAAHAAECDFLLSDLDESLRALYGCVVTEHDAARVIRAVADNMRLLAGSAAVLAHGDLDATHIFADNGHYSGIIDLGEIRGTGRFYDLGHFHLHDGERLPAGMLPHVLEGYRDVVVLPPDVERRIALQSVLVGVRFLARAHHRLTRYHRDHAIAAVWNSLDALGTA